MVQLQELAPMLLENQHVTWTLITVISLAVLAALNSWRREPSSLIDPIPGVYNTVQFLTNNEIFMKRVMLVYPASFSTLVWS